MAGGNCDRTSRPICPGRTRPSPDGLASRPATGSPQANFARHFQDLGVEGSIVIYNLNQNRTYQHNPDRNATPFLPRDDSLKEGK